MTTQELMEYFRIYVDDMQQMIFDLTIWPNSIDKEYAQIVERGLRILAEAGNKRAAAMYCAILAYNHPDLEDCSCFSEKTAAELLFKMDALDEYRTLTDKVFREIREMWDAEVFTSLIYTFPARVLLSELERLHKASTDSEDE